MTLAILAAGSAVSQAAAPPELFRFPEGAEAGSGTGQLRLPGAVAANAATGHVYVAESGNNRISEFTSEGVFVRSWGWGVVASGPSNDPHDEVQEIALDATGGSLSLVFRNPLQDGGSKNQQTAPFGFSASAAEVQGALEALASPAPGDVDVSGPAGGPWIVEFIGKYADTDISPLQIVDTSLTGTGEVKTLEGGGSFEICEAVAGDVCRAGQYSGTSPGEMAGPLRGIALDQDGNVYVLEQEPEAPEPNSRVEKFGPDGAFELMLGGGVNKTSGEDRCTGADLEAGDECGAGTPGEGPGEFAIEPFGAFENRLAIGPAGQLYVGDKDRLQEFGPDGALEGEIAVGGFVSAVAVDAAGSLYVTYFGQADIHKFTPSGLPGSPASFAVTAPKSLAVDAAGSVFAVQDPPGFGTPAAESRIVGFDASGSKLIPTAEEEAKQQFFAQKGSFTLTGLATLLCDGGQGLGALYAADSSGHVSAYGSSPGCEVPPGPKITDRYVAAADTGAATIATRINPNGFSTTFYIEYGTEPCATSSCSQQPVAPGKSLEDEGDSPVPREVQLSGLSPDTTYHYRVVATGNSITVKSEEGTFTTRRSGTGPLPDERAYEMSSPTQKNSADVAPQGGLDNFLMQAAESGSGLVYPSSTPFADPQSAPPSSAYRALRGAPGEEWSNQNISPQGAALEQQVKALSADLSTAAIVSIEPPLCCNAVNGLKNLYLRDLDTGTYTLLTTEEPRLTIPRTDYCVGIQGFTPGFGRVFFKANGALTPDAPEAAGWSLYEWSAATEDLSLVSVLPNGTPAPPTGTTSFGQPFLCEAERVVAGAISGDGSRAIWTSGSALYARVGGTETVQLDLPQGGPGAAGSGTFWAASGDGSKVFFTATNLLTAGAHPGDLYRYDFEAPPGSRLTNISGGASAAEVKGVVGASEAGDGVYFVARGVLAENEGAAVDSKGPQKAKAGASNLYLWRAAQPLRFIARLSPVANAADPASDAPAWEISPAARNAAVSADGNELAFGSIEALTGYENTSQADAGPVREVYLYDAGADQLTCASCNPTGARPLGGAALTGWKTPFTQPRFLSAGGQRLFFESFDALVAEDANGLRDVYEFERAGVGDCATTSPTYSAANEGCLDLVSSAGTGNSFFLDASASGEDVFFSTAAQLVGIDRDEKYDAYDARVGGVPQVEVATAPDCDNVTLPCRGTVPPPPATTAPATSPPLGSGNVKAPAPCPKGKVRRKGKCVSRAKHHQKHKQRNKHRRGGTGR